VPEPAGPTEFDRLQKREMGGEKDPKAAEQANPARGAMQAKA
jgi:hypothetical protein